MNSLFKGSAEDILKALNIAGELADKSSLPTFRSGLKDMDPAIVEIFNLSFKKIQLKIQLFILV